MATLQLELSDRVHDYLHERLNGHWETASAYIGELIAQDQRLKAEAHLREMLNEVGVDESTELSLQDIYQQAVSSLKTQ